MYVNFFYKFNKSEEQYKKVNPHKLKLKMNTPMGLKKMINKMLGHMKTFDVTFGSSKFVIFVSNQSLVFNVQIIVFHNEGQI